MKSYPDFLDIYTTSHQNIINELKFLFSSKPKMLVSYYFLWKSIQ